MSLVTSSLNILGATDTVGRRRLLRHEHVRRSRSVPGPALRRLGGRGVGARCHPLASLDWESSVLEARRRLDRVPRATKSSSLAPRVRLCPEMLDGRSDAPHHSARAPSPPVDPRACRPIDSLALGLSSLFFQFLISSHPSVLRPSFRFVVVVSYQYQQYPRPHHHPHRGFSSAHITLLQPKPHLSFVNPPILSPASYWTSCECVRRSVYLFITALDAKRGETGHVTGRPYNGFTEHNRVHVMRSRLNPDLAVYNGIRVYILSGESTRCLQACRASMFRTFTRAHPDPGSVRRSLAVRPSLARRSRRISWSRTLSQSSELEGSPP